MSSIITIDHKYFTSPISSKVNFPGQADGPSPLCILESVNVSIGTNLLYLELFEVLRIKYSCKHFT